MQRHVVELDRLALPPTRGASKEDAINNLSEISVGRMFLCESIFNYRGTSLVRSRASLGPYSRTVSRALAKEAGACERGNPVVPRT